MDDFTIPKHLDEPEIIGFWTLDEFLVMLVPFFWGVMAQHIIIGLFLAVFGWWSFRKVKAGRGTSWLLHLGYWMLPSKFFGVRGLPPSHIRNMVG